MEIYEFIPEISHLSPALSLDPTGIHPLLVDDQYHSFGDRILLLFVSELPPVVQHHSSCDHHLPAPDASLPFHIVLHLFSLTIYQRDKFVRKSGRSVFQDPSTCAPPPGHARRAAGQGCHLRTIAATSADQDFQRFSGVIDVGTNQPPLALRFTFGTSFALLPAQSVDSWGVARSPTSIDTWRGAPTAGPTEAAGRERRMQAVIRRKLSMAQRALDFAIAHPVADASFATVLKRLGTTVARADAIAMQESDGRTDERAAVARRKELRQSIRRNQLRRLIEIADLAARDHPELKGQFLMPPVEVPNKPFLLAARSLLAAAVPQKDLFASLGLGDTFIEDLTAATDQLEAATATAHTGRSDHVAARADFGILVRECLRDVDVIETFYRATMPGDSELLTAWESARNVAGPFRHQAVPLAPSGAGKAE